MPIWLLIIIILMLIIKIFDNEKIFYSGVRVGKNFKEFKIIKFRTLKVNTGTETMGDTVHKKDARVTPLGKFLRKFKLDELPQLFQVLTGHMSLVGPRPELPIYVDKIYYKNHGIHLLRPGLTDLSSIYFFNLADKIPEENTNEFVKKFILKKKNKLRAFYAKKNSFRLDLLIICKTIRLFF